MTITTNGSTTTTVETLTLCCEVCNEPCADEGGYLYVNKAEARKYLQEAEEYERFTELVLNGPFSHLVRLASPPPSPATWHVYHAACDPVGHTGEWVDEDHYRVRNPGPTRTASCSP